jgi:hypothetical protein
MILSLDLRPFCSPRSTFMGVREIVGSAAMATRRSSVSTGVLHQNRLALAQLRIKLLC